MPRLWSDWTDVAGGRVHARRAGESADTAVVCVHGVGVSSRYFVPTVRALAADHRVFAVDLPGFGLSDGPRRALDVTELADRLAGWIEAVGLDRPCLLGNSFGCQIVVDCAVRHVGAAGSLVLNGPTTDPQARSAAQQVARWLRNTPFESLRQAPIILRDYRDSGVRRALATFQSSLQDRIEDKLPRVGVPALVVRGTRDRIVPQAWAEEVTRLLPHGRLTVVPGAAHTLNFTHPQALAGAVREFLAEARR